MSLTRTEMHTGRRSHASAPCRKVNPFFVLMLDNRGGITLMTSLI